jgi:TRAP transporter TAXI family solute receptor
VRRFAGVLVALVLLAGCGSLVAGCASTAPPRASADLWHSGRIYVATGNTTGVYYQIGGGYADLITKHVPGYEARAEPTGASSENIQRVATGDMDVAFSVADAAGDAVLGKGAYEGKPQKIVALARIYHSYAQVVVRNSARITKFADLRGKRVSTGSAGSGADVLATRLLFAAGINPDTEIVRSQLSLPETTKAMQAGIIDALFFTGGLPTPGIADLMASAPGAYSLLPLADLLKPLTLRYGAVYSAGKLPKATYETPTDIDTIVLGNLVLVSPDMPEQLAHDLTKVLFDYQVELSRVHPEGANYDKAGAQGTDPVPLHPGAARFYSSG